MAEFLAGASGSYDYQPQKSLNQQPAIAQRLIKSTHRLRPLDLIRPILPRFRLGLVLNQQPASGVSLGSIRTGSRRRLYQSCKFKSFPTIVAESRVIGQTI
jgi:hypothetical protein